jgi:integrase/recombinase XerD
MPLRAVTLGEVQAFATALAAPEAALTPAAQARALAAAKSLLAFGHRLGYLPFDAGGAKQAKALAGRTSSPSPSPAAWRASPRLS